MGVELITKKKNLSFTENNGNVELTTPVISGGSDIELDSTLSVEGAAAEAKATGAAIGEVKKNVLTTEYYALDIQELVSAGLMMANASIRSVSSNSYELTVAAAFIPVLYENGVEYKLIDAPFEFINVNGAIWRNKKQFTNVGITSPVITQALGIDGVIWFDCMDGIMGNSGANKGSGTFVFGDDSKSGHPEAVIAVVLTARTNTSTIAYQMSGLWQQVFATAGSKLIFEYQNQENIPVYEAKNLYETTPIEGGINYEL